MDLNVKISQVVVVWDGADSGDTTQTLVRHLWVGQRGEEGRAYGSAMRRSVSLMILLGRAMVVVGGRVRRKSRRLPGGQGSGLDGEAWWLRTLNFEEGLPGRE